MKPAIAMIDEHHVAGTLENIGLFVWRHETSVPAVRAGEELMRRLAKRYPQGVGLIQVVEATAAAPSSEARKALAEFLVSGRNSVKGSTVIYETTGFKGAAMRSVVTTLNLLARPDFPHRVYSNTDEALEWLAELLPPIEDRAWRPVDINPAIDELRSHLDKYSPR